MKEIVTAEQMRRFDQETIERMGVPSCVLMERAALAVAEEALANYCTDRVLVVCGNGNNGGDGVAAARILTLRGVRCEIFPVGQPEKYSAQMRFQMDIAEKYQIPVVKKPVYEEYTVIIDAIFGTGLSRPPRGDHARVIEQINASRVPVIAVDLPSGVHTDTGQILETAVCASSTVTFAFAKPGLLLPPGSILAGRLTTAEIGVKSFFSQKDTRIWRMEEQDLAPFLLRESTGNKGTFGKLLIVAGSRETCGAALLSAEAAFRAGAGMIRVLTEETNRLAFLLARPEIMLTLYREEEPPAVGKLQEALDWADLVLLGPGMGTGSTAEQLVKWFLQNSHVPMVLDADALNLVCRMPKLLKNAGCPVIVTPHLGEMARLRDTSISALKQDLLSAARAFAAEYGVTCILKDARTVIASPDGTAFVNTSGCSALATAGSGDVLAGITAALWAHRHKQEPTASLTETAAAAVFWHGLLGQRAAAKMGEAAVLAHDLINELASY